MVNVMFLWENSVTQDRFPGRKDPYTFYYFQTVLENCHSCNGKIFQNFLELRTQCMVGRCVRFGEFWLFFTE